MAEGRPGVTAPPVVGFRADPAALQRDATYRALAARARPHERPEDILFDLGILDERTFAIELARATGLQYIGLRGFVADPALSLYVPLAVAAAERVCPVVLIGDSLKLASTYADPDLGVVRSRFPNLEIELLIAARSEIARAVGGVTQGL